MPIGCHIWLECKRSHGPCSVLPKKWGNELLVRWGVGRFALLRGKLRSQAHAIREEATFC